MKKIMIIVMGILIVISKNEMDTTVNETVVENSIVEEVIEYDNNASNYEVYGVSVTDLYDGELLRQHMFSTLDNAIDFANAYSTNDDGVFIMRFKDREEYNEDNWTEEKIVVEKSRDDDLYSILYEIRIEKFTLDDVGF